MKDGDTTPSGRIKGERYYYKPGGYETDHLIDDLSDERLLAYMGVPRKYIAHAVALTEKDFPKEVRVWLENLPYIFRPSDENLSKDMCGVGLVFAGPGATYKTTVASAVLLRVIRKKIHNTDPTTRNFTWHGAAMGRFVDWQEASDVFRSANDDDGDELIAKEIRTAMIPSGPMINRADFLVLDDISRERPTEYNAGELQRTIRRRSDNGYPTIITTNHSKDQWAANHGEVLAGFLNRSSILVEF